MRYMDYGTPPFIPKKYYLHKSCFVSPQNARAVLLNKGNLNLFWGITPWDNFEIIGLLEMLWDQSFTAISLCPCFMNSHGFIDNLQVLQVLN